MSILPSVIINKIAWFSRLKLCFDSHASLIFSVLCGTNKILRAIFLLFCSNLFQSFECDGKSISFQLYWSIKGLTFDILSRWLLIYDLMQRLKHIESNYLHHFLDFLLLFYNFNHSGVSIFKSIFWSWSRYFCKTESKKFLDSFICFITLYNFYITAIAMHSTSFFRIFRRNITDLHC